MAISRWASAVLLIALLCWGDARADPAPEGSALQGLVRGQTTGDPIGAGADAAEKAFRAHDLVRLRILATGEAPDPWLVAEELCRRDASAAARALAEAGASPDTAGLAAYVRRRKDAPTAPEAEAKLAQAGRALEAGQADAALRVLTAWPAEREDVSAVVVRFATGLTEHRLGRPAAQTVLSAADMAERLGWLAQATRARQLGLTWLLEGGQLGEAEASAMLALRLAARRGRPTDAARAHRFRAVIYNRTGDTASARDALGSARAIYASALDAGGQAICNTELGALDLEAGALAQAEARFGEALALAEKAGRPALEARAHAGLGVGLARLGNYVRAEQELETAIRLARAEKRADLVAAALANLSVVMLQRGQYSRALALGQQGLELRGDTADARGRATARMNLGLTHASLGKPKLALRYIEQARAAYAAIADRAGLSTARSNEGLVYAALGDLDTALACQQEALAIKRAMHDARGEARVLGRMGACDAERGAYARAAERLESARQLEHADGDRLGEAISLERIAQYEQQLGNLAEAEARRRQSLGLAEALCADDLAARNLWGLAELALMAADPERALASARASVQRLPRYAEGLFDEQGACARERWAGVYDVGMRAAAMQGDVRSFAWFLERQRAATLLASLGGREALLDAVVPGPLRLTLSRAREAEARAVREVREADDAGHRRAIRRARADLAHAREALRDVHGRLAREAASASRIVNPEPISFTALRGLARPGAAIVLYALLPDHAYALVATTRGVTLHALGPSRTVIEACAGLERGPQRGSTASGDDGTARGEHVLTPMLVARLRTLLIEPLGLDARVTRVSISPDGVLCGVPFQVLLPDATDATYTPSASTLAFLRADVRGRPVGRGVLALGRPIYGEMTIAGPGGTERGQVRRAHPAGVLPALEGSAAEVRAIGDTVLTDGDATEDALRAAIPTRPRWRAVHLACHGLVNYDAPLFSALALTPTASGDGLLTALDVFDLKLPTDLVVLSACETGRGRLLRTEGVFGFTRAFLFAGASRVLVSLWNVDDEATRALMAKFYALWNPRDGSRGVPAPRALHLAKEAIRRVPKWKDPSYWAAWQLWGLPK